MKNFEIKLFFALFLVLFATQSFAAYIAQAKEFDINGNFIDPGVTGSRFFDLTLDPFTPPPNTTFSQVTVSWDLQLNSNWEAEYCLGVQDCEPGNLTWEVRLGGLVPTWSDFETSPNNGITNDTDALQTGESNLNWVDSRFYDGIILSAFENPTQYLTFDLYYGQNSYGLDYIAFNGKVTVDYLVEKSPIPEPTTLLLMSLGLAGIGFARKKKLR